MNPKVMIYLENGDKFIGFTASNEDRKRTIDFRAKKEGHVGYLIGHADWFGERLLCVVYYKEPPSSTEIIRQKLEGFHGARWHSFTKEAKNDS